MRRLFLLICLALVAGALLFYLIQMEGAYVLISLGKTSVEMNFWVALLGLLLSLSSIWLIGRFFSGGYRVLSAGANRVLHGRSRTAQKCLFRGLIDFMEGNWKPAKKRLLRSVKQSEIPLINYLAAARSAYELGEHKEALELLHSAEQSSPGSELAVALTQARMQLLDKKYEQCVATLERAKKKAPRHPVVLDLLKQSYTALRDWKGLQSILLTLRKQKIYPDEKIDAIENEIHQALIVDAGEQAKRLSGGESLRKLEQAWQAIPSAVQKRPAMVETYVRQLLPLGGDAIAEPLLRSVLKKNWNENLIRLYGLVRAEDKHKQLLSAEDWLKERPGNASLMLTLGRLSLRNELWGKARDYFESSLRLQKNPETFAELARLLAHLGEYEKSTEYYQQGLLMMTNALPDLPMPKELKIENGELRLKNFQ